MLPIKAYVEIASRNSPGAQDQNLGEVGLKIQAVDFREIL